MSYFISRQISVYDGEPAVEIALGLDNSSPDALAPRFSGEFDEYDDPREAVETALTVAAAWATADGIEPPPITLAYSGAMGVYPMAADGMPSDEARTWAEAQWAAMPTCDRCGERGPVQEWMTIDGEKYNACSDSCGERMAEELVYGTEEEL